jgi:hypothetical protein
MQFCCWLVSLHQAHCWCLYLQSAGSILILRCRSWPFGWLICSCCIAWSCCLYSACIRWSPSQFSQNMPWFGQNWFWWWLMTVPMSACLVFWICYCRRFPQDRIATCCCRGWWRPIWWVLFDHCQDVSKCGKVLITVPFWVVYFCSSFLAWTSRGNHQSLRCLRAGNNIDCQGHRVDCRRCLLRSLCRWTMQCTQGPILLSCICTCGQESHS